MLLIMLGQMIYWASILLLEQVTMGGYLCAKCSQIASLMTLPNIKEETFYGLMHDGSKGDGWISRS